jgi:hypothetical protein
VNALLLPRVKKSLVSDSIKLGSEKLRLCADFDDLKKEIVSFTRIETYR